MRCPKCHYISFGSVDRCRNCGYELVLAANEAAPVDLPIQNADDPLGPLSDFALGEQGGGRQSRKPTNEPASGGAKAAAQRLDLPLFTDRGGDDDTPLVSPTATPRAPLSVRRGQPAVPKARSERPAVDTEPGARGAPVSLKTPAPFGSGDEGIAAFRSEAFSAAAEPIEPGALVTAPVIARLCAGLVDVLTLALIDAGVLASTLRLLELQFSDLQMLPPVPLAVFLLLLNGGYLAGFTTAGGQTIGKMLTGIRVVTERREDSDFEGGLRVTLGASVLRAAAYLVSLLPAGLGFLPILLDGEGRALHDRLADTRVVKA